MASNHNNNDKKNGFKNRRNGNVNQLELEANNNTLPQGQAQQMGVGVGVGSWIPPYTAYPLQSLPQMGIGIGGWMPPPGMQSAYPPQQYPPMGMGGWMPMPAMMPYAYPPQPQMGMQPIMPLAAPSHNANIHDFIQIEELDDAEPMEPARPPRAADVDCADDDEDAAPVALHAAKYNHKHKNGARVKAKKPARVHVRPPKVKAAAAAEAETEDELEAAEPADHQLAQLFDDALDINIPSRREHCAQFGQEQDHSNVIAELRPIDIHHEAHFDSARFPNETYNAVMVNGARKTLEARDISADALETGKIVHEHNTQLAASGEPIAGNAFIYVRSSRTNDVSIETQRKACLEYAAANRLELVSFGYQSDNNISARNMNNLNHELGFWKDHIPHDCHILIYSVDRLSRNLVKGIQFLDEMASRGIKFHFVSQELVFHSAISAAGRSMIQQELQTAEKYSNITSEKIRSTMARLRREGHVLGRAPYGFRNALVGNIRKRIPNNQEQENIRRIKVHASNIIRNWDNNEETAGIRYSKINVLRTLSRWCSQMGLLYRNQMNYTILQLRRIIQTQLRDDNN